MTHSQTMSDGMTDITQADRDAAHTWWMHLEHDERDLPTYFARHREAAAAEERAKIVAWLRDSKSVMKIMEPWHSRKKDGTLTNNTRENIGVAYIAMKDAADAIEAKEHLK